MTVRWRAGRHHALAKGLFKGVETCVGQRVSAWVQGRRETCPPPPSSACMLTAPRCNSRWSCAGFVQGEPGWVVMRGGLSGVETLFGGGVPWCVGVLTPSSASLAARPAGVHEPLATPAASSAAPMTMRWAPATRLAPAEAAAEATAAVAPAGVAPTSPASACPSSAARRAAEAKSRDTGSGAPLRRDAAAAAITAAARRQSSADTRGGTPSVAASKKWLMPAWGAGGGGEARGGARQRMQARCPQHLADSATTLPKGLFRLVPSNGCRSPPPPPPPPVQARRHRRKHARTACRSAAATSPAKETRLASPSTRMR